MSRQRPPRLPPTHPEVVGVVAVPLGEESWLVTTTDLDGEPLVVHAVRAALQVAGSVVVLAPPSALPGLRAVLAAAGLSRVGTGDLAGRDLAGTVGRALGNGSAGLPAGCRALLVHDPLCPLAPVSHLHDVLVALQLPDGGYRAGAAVHPMTDTVKTVEADGEGFAVAGTVDRDRLRVVTTPVVVPSDLAGRLGPATDGPALVLGLRRHGQVDLVPAPPIARRVNDRAGLHLVVGLRDVEEQRGRPAALR